MESIPRGAAVGRARFGAMGPQFTVFGLHGYWSIALLVIVVAFVLLTGVVRWRRRNDHRHFVEAFRGTAAVQNSIHPDQERLR